MSEEEKWNLKDAFFYTFWWFISWMPAFYFSVFFQNAGYINIAAVFFGLCLSFIVFSPYKKFALVWINSVVVEVVE